MSRYSSHLELIIVTIFFEGAHISLMMPREYGSVSHAKLKKIYQLMKNRKVCFRIFDFDVQIHDDPFGRRQWVVTLKIISEELNALRNQLGMKYEAKYCAHIAILEKELESK